MKKKNFHVRSSLNRSHKFPITKNNRNVFFFILYHFHLQEIVVF